MFNPFLALSSGLTAWCSMCNTAVQTQGAMVSAFADAAVAALPVPQPAPARSWYRVPATPARSASWPLPGLPSATFAWPGLEHASPFGVWMGTGPFGATAGFNPWTAWMSAAPMAAAMWQPPWCAFPGVLAGRSLGMLPQFADPASMMRTAMPWMSMMWPLMSPAVAAAAAPFYRSAGGHAVSQIAMAPAMRSFAALPLAMIPGLSRLH